MNALNSPLLRLPAELRNAIFAYVFSSNVYVFDGASVYRDKTTSLTSFNENNLGVLVTSRQLHAETALLPYQLALFRFEFGGIRVTKGEWSHCVERFVKSRTKVQELVAIKNMTVTHVKMYVVLSWYISLESFESYQKRTNGCWDGAFDWQIAYWRLRQSEAKSE
ncbi:uncharacterized protein J4E92_008949 [Alternaria infectoria]|uniref:uncharacterized protein n=1 Tax=Alternaria infectoria TaxID=45303 RepID=UPI0022210409|nr:uncharacterized protein J4E92_008949 [Alternaria infectoria]KAI4917555.1 hypothetical protein J4E92_008949 [Alternaria infectoria]